MTGRFQPIVLLAVIALVSDTTCAERWTSALHAPPRYRNVSAAMSPTIREGEYIPAVPLADSDAVASAVHRRDIVVYAWPIDTTKQYVKRVVGLPGDTLAMRGGVLLVNGRAVAEPYAWHAEGETDPTFPEFAWQRQYEIAHSAVASTPSRNNCGPLALPHGSYFVLGDNRDNSLDSRFDGFLPARLILGRVVADRE